MDSRKQRVIEKKNLVEDIHYYNDGGKIVFTAQYHKERGRCCGNKCRHCPFDPLYQKGNKILKTEECPRN